jgi:RimJ/RimL family protein N-acetyltransferase
MSSKLIYGDEQRLIPWALSRIGIPAFRRDAYSIGLERDGELVAVVVFDSFSECDCNIHVASDGTAQWMNKAFLLATFAYPFGQLGLRRVTGMVPAHNEAALKFDENLGFVREGYHKHALPDGDIISLGMMRENCRFFKDIEPAPTGE